MPGKKEKKGIAWYIPPPLRHWLNSHAEYLSAIGKEISTDEMVVGWLKERVKIEERKRDASKLEGAVETQLAGEPVLDSNHESRQREVRSGSTPNAAKASAKNLRHKGPAKGSTKD
jgi:pyruvoyl-dependent arginine decarboxylase (PvlArgDC)